MIISPSVQIYDEVCLELKPGNYKEIFLANKSKVILNGIYKISRLFLTNESNIEINNSFLKTDHLTLNNKVNNYEKLINEIDFSSLELLRTEISSINKEVVEIKLIDSKIFNGLNQTKIKDIRIIGSECHFEKISFISSNCFIQESKTSLSDDLIIKGDLEIIDSKIKLPKKLEVFGNFTLDYCEIEEWPDEMIIHGCFDFNGESLPPNLDKYKINRKKLFLANEGMVELDE